MAKIIYCSNCGQRLTLIRKAFPKLGHILEVVDPHECTKEPQELDLTPMQVPQFQPEPKGKFVQNLNELYSKPEGSLLNNTLKDRRPDDQTKSSSAPNAVLDTLKSMQHQPPDKEIPDNDPE